MKKKKITIIGCCFALMVIILLFITNSGMKLKYDMKARSIAESYKKNKADEFKEFGVKVGKLKYDYTTYNADLNVYNVVYYARWVEEEESEWLLVSVKLSGSKLIFSEVDDSNMFAGKKEKTIRNFIISPSSPDGKESKWVLVDRMKHQGTINTLLWLIFYFILMILLLVNKSKIKDLYDTMHKNIIVKNDKSVIVKNNNNVKKLDELSSMLDSGLITVEEFQSKKMEILEKM